MHIACMVRSCTSWVSAAQALIHTRVHFPQCAAPLSPPSPPPPPPPQVDWFMSAEQEASTEALTHRWDPSGQAAVARLEAFIEQVREVH